MDKRILKEVERRLFSERRSSFRFQLGELKVYITRLKQNRDLLVLNENTFNVDLKGRGVSNLIEKIGQIVGESAF